jgi:hypothetical protein
MVATPVTLGGWLPCGPSAAPDDQVTQDDVTGGRTSKPPVTKPPKVVIERLPKPSFEGLATIPDSPHIGTALHLPPAPGEVIFVLDIANATRAQFWLAPTGTRVSAKALWLGEDRNGRNGWTARWRYTEEVPLAHLIVRATGPGGTTEEFYALTNNGGMDPSEEVTEEVTENQEISEDQKP